MRQRELDFSPFPNSVSPPTTATVATIISIHDKRKREDLIQKFDAFYYGPMVILEHRGDSADPSKHQAGEKYAHDANVELHMLRARTAMRRLR